MRKLLYGIVSALIMTAVVVIVIGILAQVLGLVIFGIGVGLAAAVVYKAATLLD
jgi:hypothetical protein